VLDARQIADLRAWIAAHDDHVGHLAGLERAESLVHAEDARRAERGGVQRTLRRQPRLDEERDLETHARPVGDHRIARVRADADLESRVEHRLEIGERALLRSFAESRHRRPADRSLPVGIVERGEQIAVERTARELASERLAIGERAGRAQHDRQRRHVGRVVLAHGGEQLGIDLVQEHAVRQRPRAAARREQGVVPTPDVHEERQPGRVRPLADLAQHFARHRRHAGQAAPIAVLDDRLDQIGMLGQQHLEARAHARHVGDFVRGDSELRAVSFRHREGGARGVHARHLLRCERRIAQREDRGLVVVEGRDAGDAAVEM
jgi:hypothetical protein